MSLARSGLVPVGKLIPPEHKDWSGSVKPGAAQEECNINLHLLPTNINPQDNFGSHCVKRTDREGKISQEPFSLYYNYTGQW